MLCESCLNFFHLNLDDHYFTYGTGRCEGCFKLSLVTNPEYSLYLVPTNRENGTGSSYSQENVSY